MRMDAYFRTRLLVMRAPSALSATRQSVVSFNGPTRSPMAAGHGLPFYALVSWLLTELIGALMVRSWIAGGGMRAARQRPSRPDAMSLPVLAGHAGLNLAGLISWVCFVVSGVTALAWLALALMAPAIGLGISTVAIWTPYPGPRSELGPDSAGKEPGVLSQKELARALADDELSQRLVDELL